MTFINFNIDNHETEVKRFLMISKLVNENFLSKVENFIQIFKALSIQSAGLAFMLPVNFQKKKLIINYKNAELKIY
jgi:hypothetical protein